MGWMRRRRQLWHYILGLCVFFLVWVRITARLIGKTPPIVPAAQNWQLMIANTVELALYALMIALPLPGWVMLSAEGEAIPFFGLQLPALVGANEALAERTKEGEAQAGASVAERVPDLELLTPVHDSRGRALGVIVGVASTEQLVQLMRDISKRLPGKGSVVLRDRKNRVLFTGQR